jgi:hypothetical protein
MFGRTRIHTRLKNPFGDGSQFVYALFENGEQGFAYNTNRFDTMWQDSAQTTPVTAADQPVGFQLDLSGNGNHRYQTAAASRPMLRYNATTGSYYLQYDGTDDFLVTNAINFTATDKVSVFAGVRKLSDAATGMICELGSDTVAAGVFYILGAAGIFQSKSRGTLTVSPTTGSVYAAPVSAVLTAYSQISTKTALLRVNGSTAAQSTADQGTGNYGNYAMYFGRRAGTSLPFNGHEYSPVCVGRLTTAAEIANIERMLARQVGVNLA